eukprot:403343927
MPEYLLTGDKCFQLQYDFSREYSIPRLIGAFFKAQAITDSDMFQSAPSFKDYFPVITSVKHIDHDTVEVKRSMIYRKFHNSIPYPEETIRINRRNINNKPQDVVLDSFCEFGFKQEMTRLYGVGFMVKRQFINIDSHKAFQTVKNLQLMSDIYMYKNLKECSQIFKVLEPRSKSKVSKDSLGDLRMAELTDLI